MNPEQNISVPVANGNKKIVLVSVTCVVFGLLIGILIGMQIPNRSLVAPNPVGNPQNNPLVLNQTATGTGVITAINGKTITLSGQNGQTQDFKLGEVITIYKYPARNAPAEVFNSIDAIDLGKQAVLNMSTKGDTFEVSTITYLEPSNETSSNTATQSGTSR